MIHISRVMTLESTTFHQPKLQEWTVVYSHIRRKGLSKEEAGSQFCQRARHLLHTPWQCRFLSCLPSPARCKLSHKAYVSNTFPKPKLGHTGNWLQFTPKLLWSFRWNWFHSLSFNKRKLPAALPKAAHHRPWETSWVGCLTSFIVETRWFMMGCNMGRTAFSRTELWRAYVKTLR